MQRIDIHDFSKRMPIAIDSIRNFKTTDKNKKTIARFCDYMVSEGLTAARVVKYITHLKKISGLMKKNFEEVRRKDIEKLFIELEKCGYSEWTKKDFKVVCKRFFKWLRKSEVYPPEVRWLKATVRNGNSKLPEEMLTEDEIRKMIRASEHPRDKALIFTLYESGCRIGEVASLRIRNIEFDQYGARLIVHGKTGMRRVRLVAAAPILAAWLDVHPLRDDPDACVWVGIGTKNKNQPMRYSSYSVLLRKTALKAGIKKKVHPHLFRHSRATELADKLTEAQLKEMFGWVQSSDQAATYVHLSGRNVDDALLNLYGVKKEKPEEKESKLKLKECQRCSTVNSATSKFCNRCAAALDLKAVMDLEEERSKWDNELSEFLRDPEVQALYLKKRVAVTR